MENITLSCPFCQFTKQVSQSRIPHNVQSVTCPKCQKRFALSACPVRKNKCDPSVPRPAGPTEDRVELEGDIRKPQNLRFAILFLLLFLALLVGRLYSSNRAQNAPAPNLIAASKDGIATLWRDQILVTDFEGELIRKIPLPAEIVPTQILWAGEEIWIADYRTKKILIVNESGPSWLLLKGPEISAHFKVVPDISRDRIYISDGAGHKIRVYDSQGNFRASFGKEGPEGGAFRFPNQFLMEETGNLLISNTKSPAVDRYSPEGEFLGRVVVPVGDATYKYPTNVAIAPDRIVTLESDGYLQEGRIAYYTSEGEYLGRHEPVENFMLIGDIAIWGDRVFATDITNAKVYAFAVADLHFLGEYSNDLKQVGENSRGEFRFWAGISTGCMVGLLVILVPLLYFYFRFRKAQTGATALQVSDARVATEHPVVNKADRFPTLSPNCFNHLDFIAVQTDPVIGTFSALFIILSVFGLQWTLIRHDGNPDVNTLSVMVIAVVLFGIGLLLGGRSEWACPVTLKKAHKLLGRLVKNQGLELIAGVEKVGIAHCVDKTTHLLLLTSQVLIRAEFNVFGKLKKVTKVDYAGISVRKKDVLIPMFLSMFILNIDGKVMTYAGLDRDFMDRLRDTIVQYKHQYSQGDYVPRTSLTPVRPGKVESAQHAPKKQLNVRAALLSALFPGLGQFYKRHILRGAVFMAAFTLGVFFVAVNFEPIVSGSVDWIPESIFGFAIILTHCLLVFSSSVWDALKN